MVKPLEPGEIEESIIETEDPEPEKRTKGLKKDKIKKGKSKDGAWEYNFSTEIWELIRQYQPAPSPTTSPPPPPPPTTTTPPPTSTTPPAPSSTSTTSIARDSCGEGKSQYYQTSSRAIWKSFPVLVYIDESKYPGTEPKSLVRSEIIACLRQVNELVGFSFFSVRLDPNICKVKISFEPLDTGGIGHCSWRTRDGAITSAIIRLNTGTRWFINPYEQCGSSGRLMHMPATMMHEIGHGIGLGHNDTDNLATMRPYGQSGETLRETFGLSEKTFLAQKY